MSNPDADAMETTRLVTQRADFLECLSTTPREKRDLVDELDYSRSTVDRAVRDLEMHGLVERAEGGYVTTLSGQVGVEQYQQFVETTVDTLGIQGLVDHLPYDAPVDGRLCRDATVHRANDTAPYTPVDQLLESLERADRLTVLAASLPDPRIFDLVTERSQSGELTADVVVSERLWETLQSRQVEMLATIDAAGVGFSVGDVPQFDLYRIHVGDETSVHTVVHGDTGSILGVVSNDTPDAVKWADELVATVHETAESVTADLPSDTERPKEGSDATERDGTDQPGTGPSATSTASNGQQGGVAGPKDLTLEREGFVQLSEAYFERRVVDPITCWQVGMELTEVRAGYAIDREYERDGERRLLTDDLLASLRAGDDHVVLGPPGSGKSTVCKRAACRWFEADEGPVYYRESGVGASFRSVTHLADRLRRTDGHALVVVEDAPRSEANAVFRLLREFADADDVTFLFDARTNEWDDPPASLDARLDALRREVLTTVSVPPLDERECDRLVEQFVTLADHDVDLTGADLLAGIRGDDTDPDEATSGELLLVLHRLTQAAQRTGTETETTTTLLEAVRDTYETLSDAGDDVLDAGVLVNLLNATGLGVRPEFVHALAGDGTRQTTGDGRPPADGDHRAIDESLTALEGRIIFERERGEGSPYRSVHELWSTHFLEYLLEAEGRRDAQRRVGRCVTALLSLADDADLRERIDWEFAGEAPGLVAIERDPTDWADSTVERLFQLGQDRPGLAPLYGASDYSRIDLPDACSAEMRIRVAEWRGRMFRHAGTYDDAAREFELVLDRVEAATLSDTRRTELRALAHKLLGTTLNDAGDYEAAADHYEQALELYRDLDQPKGQAQCLNNLGTVAYVRGDRAGAEDYFERSLAYYRELDAKTDMADTLNNLGVLARSRGDLAAGQQYHEQSIALYEQVGSRQDVADALGNLGTGALNRGDIDAAERYATRHLDIGRDIGYPRAISMALENLGAVARLRGQVDDAVAHLEEARELVQNIGDRWSENDILTRLGRAYRDRGDLADAAATFRQLRSLARDIENPQGVAAALNGLASVALERGDLTAARAYAEWSLARGLGDEHVMTTATAHRLLGAVARTNGQFERAHDHLATAHDLFADSGFTYEQVRVVVERAELAAARGDVTAASEQFADAETRFREMGATADAEAVAERLEALDDGAQRPPDGTAPADVDAESAEDD